MRSKMPIAASNPAACVSGMPWSPHAGTRCVPIKPFVLAPQMKNEPGQQPKRSRARGAPRSTANASRSGLRLMRRRGLDASPPQGGMPTSTGRSRIKNQQRESAPGQRSARTIAEVAPAAVIDQHAEHRQEDELTGRVTGAEDADHEAALGYEPTIGNRSAHRKRQATDADAGRCRPEQQLPGSCRSA